MLFGLTDEWTAWDFDHAVFVFGAFVDAELDACKTTADRQRKLHKLLGVKRKVSTISLADLEAMGIQVHRG